MTEVLLIIILVLSIVGILILLFKSAKDQSTGNTKELFTKIEYLEKSSVRIENIMTDHFRMAREENGRNFKEIREELTKSINTFQDSFIKSLSEISKLQNQQLENLTQTNQAALDKMTIKIEEKISALIEKLDLTAKNSREELGNSLKEFRQSFTQNVQDFNEMQRQKFNELVLKQDELVKSTEQKLEKMRETVDEKLQKTLEARLGQSFELVSKQLESVQKGLGEMQTLANDVGGLKKVLSNVKTRGILGEIQLGNILEQILAPEQYESNVKTKKGSQDIVEYAIKLPGKDDFYNVVYLPIDAKFPQEPYYALQNAYDMADAASIDSSTKALENAIKKSAKDIRDKYIDPPNTTDFGIMFLPVEGLYAEVIRRTDLMEQLQRDYKIVVTGPTTLAAILNSLQMGFKTLAIQKRSSEVWNILKAVKTEFGEFGKVLTKAQEKITSAGDEIDKLVGVRTRQIQKRLKDVEILNPEEAQKMITETDNNLLVDEPES